MPETKTLRSIAQPSYEPFLWARLYGRSLSWPVTVLVLRTPLSAGAVSILSMLVAVLGGACFAFNTTAWNLAGVLLLLFSWVLDCVDGEVARARGTACLDGEFIDACRHQIACPALFAGLTMGVLARHPNTAWLVALGLCSAALSTRFTGGMIDQLVLAGVRRALRRKRPAATEAAGDAGEGLPQRSGGLVRCARLFSPLFVDFNILHVLMVAVAVDALGARAWGWTPLDMVHIAYGVALPVVKLGSMAVAWRRGVSGLVEDVLAGRGVEEPSH
jgi:hypothetical protein